MFRSQCVSASAAAAALAFFLPLGALAGGGDTDTDLIEAGRTLFTSTAVPACAICHTLKDAGTSGMIGPDLDELKPEAKRVETALRGGIGVMPAYEALTDDEVATLSKYIARVTGANAE